MKQFMKKLRATLHWRETRARAARVRYPPPFGYEAAWPASRVVSIPSTAPRGATGRSAERGSAAGDERQHAGERK
jgi:hypothetical protein